MKDVRTKPLPVQQAPADRPSEAMESFVARIDPEVAQMLDAVPHLDLDDLQRAREERRRMARRARGGWVPPAQVHIEDRVAQRSDGGEVRIRVYRPVDPAAEPRGLLCWMHGGGHVIGDVEQDDVFLSDIVVRTKAGIVSVDWRHAPEHPYPAAIDDSYAALLWAAEHAPELGATEDGIVVGGASSGGGLAAGLALLARDRGEVRPRAQLLIYPMLDDRGITPSSRSVHHPKLWTSRSNELAWAHYLSGVRDRDVPPYAAPSRAGDLSDLPATWMATGELDLFVDENLNYAQRLMQHGVAVELHVYPGAVHGFDLFAPTAQVSTRFKAERDGAVDRLLTGDQAPIPGSEGER